MAVDPESAARLARGVLALYLDAERSMLERVARRIGRGITEEGWATQKLAEISALRRDAQAVVRALESGVPTAVVAAITKAHELGISEAVGELTEAGLEAITPARPRTVRALISETIERLAATHLRILRVADDAYRVTIARASAPVVVGVETRRQAAQLALNAFADAGVTGFVDNSGRSWSLASYAEMATRTATGRAANNGHMEAIRAAGHDLVIVSDSPRECAWCRPFEGKVLSITGNDERYRSVASAVAAGLFHPGCTHGVGIYIPGITKPPTRTADPAGDRAKQQQRYLERGLRQWKRRETVAISDHARAFAHAKVIEWRQRLQEHIAAHDLKRQSHREQISAAI